MSQSTIETLIEDRVAQLQLITQRRNALLRQMYQMICRRENVGVVLRGFSEEEEEEEEVGASHSGKLAGVEGLSQFLERFDLAKHPETASIANLDVQILVPSSPQVSRSPSKEGTPAFSEQAQLKEDADEWLGLYKRKRRNEPIDAVKSGPSRSKRMHADTEMDVSEGINLKASIREQASQQHRPRQDLNVSQSLGRYGKSPSPRTAIQESKGLRRSQRDRGDAHRTEAARGSPSTIADDNIDDNATEDDDRDELDLIGSSQPTRLPHPPIAPRPITQPQVYRRRRDGTFAPKNERVTPPQSHSLPQSEPSRVVIIHDVDAGEDRKVRIFGSQVKQEEEEEPTAMEDTSPQVDLHGDSESEAGVHQDLLDVTGTDIEEMKSVAEVANTGEEDAGTEADADADAEADLDLDGIEEDEERPLSESVDVHQDAEDTTLGRDLQATEAPGGVAQVERDTGNDSMLVDEVMHLHAEMSQGMLQEQGDELEKIKIVVQEMEEEPLTPVEEVNTPEEDALGLPTSQLQIQSSPVAASPLVKAEEFIFMSESVEDSPPSGQGGELAHEEDVDMLPPSDDMPSQARTSPLSHDLPSQLSSQTTGTDSQTQPYEGAPSFVDPRDLQLNVPAQLTPSLTDSLRQRVSAETVGRFPVAEKFSPSVAIPSPGVRMRPVVVSGLYIPSKDDGDIQFEFADADTDVHMHGDTERDRADEQQQYHRFNPQYTLPPLKALPAEYQRRGKGNKSQRKKRDKDKDRECGNGNGKDDNCWAPMGINKWGATLNANPVWNKVSKAHKCLMTREWAVALTELRLIRTLSRIEQLKDAGRWSLRQPKKQRAVGGLMKTHWDYLMDEMKWMRTDFREERKWKLALAYNLSTAVLKWHDAGSMEERITKGICIPWKRPRDEQISHRIETVFVGEDVRMEDPHISVTAAHAVTGHQQQTEPEPISSQACWGTASGSSAPLRPASSLLMVDYGSEDEEEDDQDQDQDQDQDKDPSQDDVDDALGTSTMIEDALDIVTNGDESQSQDSERGIGPVIYPKTEEVDDSSALRGVGNSMEVDSMRPTTDNEAVGKQESAGVREGLKSSSENPLLTTESSLPSNMGDKQTSTQLHNGCSKSKNPYASLRGRIAYFDEYKLFLDIGDLDITKTMSELSTSDTPPPALDPLPPPPDLSAIFPDLQPYGLLDVANVSIASNNPVEGKRKSEKKSDKDDPNKRAEDTTYSKLTPIGMFMHCKPTLIGPLQPSRRWINGKWARLDDYVISVDDTQPSKIPAEVGSDMFHMLDMIKHPPMITPLMQSAKEGKEQQWTTNDDSLLKSLIDKYGTNWALIAECFNSSRFTVSTDRRTPRDCFLRWETFRGLGNQREHGNAPPPATTQMTTRGVKRLASVNVAGPSAGITSGSVEPKKRRRHMLVQDTLRKLTKQRAAAAQRAALTPRKPSIIHDTHVQYAKLPKVTPSELSRMKADRDARESQEIMLARRRQEDLARQQQQLLREQAHRMQVAANGQQTSQQPPPQVGISQHQQRISTPISANSRLSPQQVAQVQVQHLQQQRNLLQQTQQQAQGQQVQASPAPTQSPAQAQGQVPIPNQHAGTSLNGVTQVMNNVQHLSPPAAPSPLGAYTSPPRNTGTPSNAANSPRPPSAQAQAALLQNVQAAGNAISRQANIGYYLHNTFSPEQIQAAMRMQLLQQAQQAHQQGAAQQQTGQNNNFPSQSS